MVEFKIIIGNEAKNNLQNIHYYIKNKASINIANKVVSGIFASIEILRTIPKGHVIVHEISSKKQTYHRILKWSYKIVFVIDEIKKEVKVVDIIHTNRNPQYVIDKYRDEL